MTRWTDADLDALLLDGMQGAVGALDVADDESERMTARVREALVRRSRRAVIALAAAAVLLLVVTVGAAVVGLPGPPPTPAPSEIPNARSEHFGLSFSYWSPTDRSVQVSQDSERFFALFEGVVDPEQARAETWDNGDGDLGSGEPNDHGIAIAVLNSPRGSSDVNVQPCQPRVGSPARIRIHAQPPDIWDDLTSLACVEVGEARPRHVDGAQGDTRMVRPLSGQGVHVGEVHINDGHWVSLIHPSELTVVDVHGYLLAIQIWAVSDDALNRWLPVGAKIVGSITFGP
jgi:hypothetical protein